MEVKEKWVYPLIVRRKAYKPFCMELPVSWFAREKRWHVIRDNGIWLNIALF